MRTYRDLSDDEVLRLLAREASRRREAADAFAAAGRADQAATERAEDGVLAGYLPAQLSDVELAAIVTEVISETGASGMAAMGQVMRAGHATGGRPRRGRARYAAPWPGRQDRIRRQARESRGGQARPPQVPPGPPGPLSGQSLRHYGRKRS